MQKVSIIVTVFLIGFLLNCGQSVTAKADKEQIAGSALVSEVEIDKMVEINKKVDLSTKEGKLEEKDINKENIENIYQNVKIATLLWTNGMVEYEQRNNQWKILGPRDEIEITSRIRINDAETDAVFRIDGNQNIKLSGRIPPTIFNDASEFYLEKEDEESESVFGSILSMFSFSSEEDYGKVSGVTRGDGIMFKDDDKIDFYFKNEINLLNNNNALIFWNKDDLNSSGEYEFKMSYLDYNTFSEVDSIFKTNDTILILESARLVHCDPCTLELISPKERYNNSEIELYFDQIIPKELQLVDSVLNENINNHFYSYAKVQWLVKNQYFENALSLLNELAKENDYYDEEYNNLIEILKSNYEN